MTQTTRRTQRMASAPRGYVAIEVGYVSENTQRIACVANWNMQIKGVNGAIVEIAKGEAFYLVRSDSLSKQLGKAMFYIVRMVSGEKKCSCPAAKPCKHETGLASHIAEHGQSPMHLRARQRQAEQSKAAAHLAVDEPAQREMQVIAAGGDYLPQYRDGEAWQRFTDEQGYNVAFAGGYESLAYKFIKVDSDEHRAAVLAELAQAIAESEAYIAKCKAEEERRESAPLNGNRGFSLLRRA